MFSIWFFILKASASAILGQSTNAWFKKTKFGVWFYAKVERTLNWAAKRYDFEIATKEERAIKAFNSDRIQACIHQLRSIQMP